MTQTNQNQKGKYLILADLLKKTDYNANISEIENKIPSISGLATNSVLTVIAKHVLVENELGHSI